LFCPDNEVSSHNKECEEVNTEEVSEGKRQIDLEQLCKEVCDLRISSSKL
jgi:hypothetical protein